MKPTPLRWGRVLALIRDDAHQWAKAAQRPERGALLRALRRPEFRSLAYTRMRRNGGACRYAAATLRRLVPPERTLHILSTDIGTGTRFIHGFATVILAERIGENCSISHNVTIGDSPTNPGYPTIGARVLILPGAVVSGAITIGDDAVIGANSVVTRDVPAGEVHAGAPARRVAYRADLFGLTRWGITAPPSSRP